MITKNRFIVASLIVAVGMFFIGLNNGFAEGKKKFNKKNLPPAVLSAFEKTYPKAKINGGGKEEENGKTYYEIESVDGKVKRDLLYDADGNVFETEEGIAVKDLPEMVAKTLKEQYSKSKILKSEKVTHATDVEYEFLLSGAKGKSEIVIDSKGAVVRTEKNGEGKEKDDDD